MNIKAVEGCISLWVCDIALQSSLRVIINFYRLPMTDMDPYNVFRGSEKVYRSISVLVFHFPSGKVLHLLENARVCLLMTKLLTEIQVGPGCQEKKLPD